MKVILSIFLILLLAAPIAIAAAVDDTSGIMRDIADRLERNKAEIVRAVQDNEAQMEAKLNASVEENFAALDQRQEGFFRNAQRDIAVIVVAGYVSAFVISQLIRLQIEKMRRTALINKDIELEHKVMQYQKEAIELMKEVKQLRELQHKYNIGLTQAASRGGSKLPWAVGFVVLCVATIAATKALGVW